MKSSFLLIGLILMWVTSCAQVETKKPYEPEIRKEITFTFDAPEMKDKKEGLSISFAKSELMNATYEVNACPVMQPGATQPSTVPPSSAPKPAAAVGLMGSLMQTVAAPKEEAPVPATTAASPATKGIKTNLVPENTIVFDVSITNGINHVNRLSNTLFFLRAPNNALYEAQGFRKTDWFTKTPWCATTKQVSDYEEMVAPVRALTSSVFMLPHEKSDFKLIFNTANKNIVGDWKIEIYEFPIATNAAGVPTITDHFTGKAIVKKWETTFKKSTPEGAFEKVETKEIL